MGKRFIACCLVFAFLLGSCTTFREVNQYAATSVASLSTYNDLDYSFTEYCSRDCELQQLRAEKLDTFYNCKCVALATQADDVLLKIQATLVAYLQAVQHLTDNTSFNYNVSGLTGALQANPLLQLNQQQTDIITKAGNFIANAATTVYRRRKLSNYLGQSDSIFQELTSTFRYLVNDRLRKQVRMDYEQRYTNLKQKIVDTNERGLKQLLVSESLSERQQYLERNEQLNQFVKLLDAVSNGHHELYLRRNRLKDATTADLMKSYAEQIKDLLETLKVINI